MKKILCFIMCLLGFTIIFGCQDTKSDKLTVVSTTTMITDLVKEIAGDKVYVIGLMETGVDPHSYNATAGDISKISSADVIIYNGVNLEGKFSEVLSNIEGKRVICVSDALEDEDFLLTTENEIDPHIWFDVSLWIKCAEYVSETLSEIDSENSDYYKMKTSEYISELEDLIEYVESEINTLEQKVLVTAHDAFGYFGQAYGVEVLGVQGISTNTEATINDINNLANIIAEKKIKAVFAESSVSLKTVEALIEAVSYKGFETKVGGELFSDSLGVFEENAYINTVKSNVQMIVSSLE